MFKHYLTIALRNFRKHKTYSFINLFGLAIGIACCLLILTYIHDEWTYDRFHPNAETIFRVVSFFREESGEMKPSSQTQPPLGPALQQDLPEVKAAVRFWRWANVVRYEDKLATEIVHFTDPALLTVFSFPFIEGDPARALADPNAVVISQRTAERYFGVERARGKRLSIRLGETDHDFIVTGVAQNMPENSSLKFNFLISFDKVAMVRGQQYAANWGNFAITTFVQLQDKSQAAAVDAKFPQLVKKYLSEEIKNYWGGHEQAIQFRLQAFTDIHLNTEFGSGALERVSDPKNSYILAGIAFFVLAIACINFMNLAIARSSSRLKEIGVRQATGAQRAQLMNQFWGEAFLMSALALLLGLVLAELFMPVFSDLANKKLALDYQIGWATLAGLLGLMCLTGLIAGSYPALMLSGLKPVEVLQGKLKFGGSDALTKALIVTQFALSVVLIVSMMIMQEQIRFFKTTNLGYNAEQLIFIPTESDNGERLMEVYRDELARDNRILSVSGSQWGEGNTDVEAAGTKFRATHFRIDYEYFKTFGIALKEGRNFSRDFATDKTNAVIVNETFVKKFGWQQPVGRQLTFEYGSIKNPTIIGVVKDFHFASLREEIRPLMMHLDRELSVDLVWVKISPLDVSSTLALLEDTWRKVAPNTPFRYKFLEDHNQQQYLAEERWGQIVSYSAIFAMIIACLGLFGLAALLVVRRTKEIGIRKVLGASTAGIVNLLSRDFAKLVVVANFIAWPLAYFAMSQWLQDFAYRIHLNVWTFLVAGILAISVALLTISFQALKSALANPVEALRYE
jgi:putative ABC transport system permease protein